MKIPEFISLILDRFGFEPTADQMNALQCFGQFLASRNDMPMMLMRGSAGTGKTSLVSAMVQTLVSLHQKVVLMAPTGRAARVLLKKTGCEACTIHKGIYDKSHYVIKEVKDIAESSYKVVFGIKNDNMLPIVIVDEASMVSSKKAEHELFEFGTSILLDDLLTFVKPSFGGKVIFIGDPAQLPPVGDNHSCALDEDFFKDKGLKCEVGHLTQVLRQGGESTILKNAMKIRDIINSGQRNKLAFEEKDGEVVSLNANNVVDKYLSLGCEAVLIKGGHLEGDRKIDKLYLADGRTEVYEHATIETRNTHGTGCTLSSAIASFLARGLEMCQAIAQAKDYLSQAIEAGKDVEIGKGHGPVDHFFNLEKLKFR